MDNTVPPVAVPPTPVLPTPVPQAPPTPIPPTSVPPTSAPQVSPTVVPPPTPAPEDSGSKNGFKAFLLEAGIIAVLVVILLFVLSYFKIINLESFLPSSSFGKPTKSISSEVQVKNNNPPETGLTNLSKLKKNNVLHYATATSEFEGTINAINTKGGIIPGRNKRFAIEIILGLGESMDTFTLLYSQESLPKIKVLANSGKELKSIQLSDLKVGDKVVVKQTTNTIGQYPNVLIDTVITKSP